MLLIDPSNNAKAVEFLIALDPSFLNQNLKVSIPDVLISPLHCDLCRHVQQFMRICNQAIMVRLKRLCSKSIVPNVIVFGHRPISFKSMDHPRSVNLNRQHSLILHPTRPVIPKQLVATVKTINSDDDDQNDAFRLVCFVSFFLSFSNEKSMRTVHIMLL